MEPEIIQYEKEEVEAQPKQIEGKSYGELITSKVYYNPTLINPLLKSGKAIIGEGDESLRFQPDIGFWLGNASFGSAPFRVDMNGNVTATEADISGKLIAGSGSSIDWSYIQNVLVRNAQIANLAVDDAKISDVSADKLTAGTIDANDINVINLNADNIKTGTLTGRTVRTSSGTTRVEMQANDNALYVYENGNKTLEVSSDSIYFYYQGNIRGSIHGITSNGIRIFGWNTGKTYFAAVDVQATAAATGAFLPCWGHTIDLGTSEYPFQNLYLSGNIYVGGTVDGVDISAHAGNASAHHIRYTDSEARSAVTDYNLPGDLDLNVHDVEDVKYLKFNSTYGQMYWGTDLFMDIYNDRIEWGKHLVPRSTSLDLNLGSASLYWNEINYKYLTDRGCLGWFDKGVELQNGEVVSDLEALKRIKKHPKLKTGYGTPRLDYSTMPKAVYKPVPTAKKNIYDERTKKLLYRKGEKIGEDGAELTALISIMIGAIKELDSRLEKLEAKIK